MTNKEITTMKVLKSTRDDYMLFKIKTKAKNLDEVLQKGLKLLKEELRR